MSQDPSNVDLLRELEPVAEKLINRHMSMFKEWNPHDYIPWKEGKNYYALGGQDWDPEQAKLSEVARVAMVQNLLTEDNLPAYHREIAMNFSMDGPWGYWVNRWTAEENLHAIAIRDYLVVTRNVDPVADEQVRVNHVMRGYRASNYTQIETLVFMALLERAHAVYVRNLEARIQEPVLKKLVGRIASDEERHQEFFDNLVVHCLENHRDSTLAAIARRAVGFPVIGGDILEYRETKLRTVAETGIFDQAAADKVVTDAVAAWGLAGEPVLKKFASA